MTSSASVMPVCIDVPSHMLNAAEWCDNVTNLWCLCLLANTLLGTLQPNCCCYLVCGCCYCSVMFHVKSRCRDVLQWPSLLTTASVYASELVLQSPWHPERKGKTTPLGVNLMRSQVLYRAALGIHVSTGERCVKNWLVADLQQWTSKGAGVKGLLWQVLPPL